MKYRNTIFFGILAFMGCGGVKYKHTSSSIDLPRYMGSWYVWAGRTTFVEKDAHNAIEKYTWNSDKNRVDIDFTFHKGSANGKIKSLPQKAWIVAGTGNAHWKIQPFWPLKLDYLVVAVDPNYEWTAVGVPNGNYLWIMGRKSTATDAELSQIMNEVEKTGYPVANSVRVPQEWQ